MQLSAGKVLTADPFSLTMAGQPWRTQSWLAEILYGSLEKIVGGLSWVPWLLILCGGLVIGLVGISAFKRIAGPIPVALSLFALIWLGLPNLVPRPVIFSFVLLALLVVVLDVEAHWAAPLILWVWAGIHGSFVLGLGLLILDSLRRRLAWRPAVWRLVISLVAVSVTAHGPSIWLTLTSFVRNREALEFISEWATPDLFSIAVAPYVLMMIAVMIGAASGRIEVDELWIVIPFMLFGLTSARALMPAAIVLAPFAASAWPAGIRDVAVSRSQARANVVIAAALMVLPLLAVAGFQGIDKERFPVEASRHLEADAVWHDDATGGYLIFAGRLPVFVDDRAELYGAEFFREFVDTRRGAPTWRPAFDRYGITQALVADGSGLAEVLEAEGWRIDFSDDRWTVFSRS